MNVKRKRIGASRISLILLLSLALILHLTSRTTETHAQVLAPKLVRVGNLTFAEDTEAKKEQATPAAPLSGARMFKQYCAVCHGKDAKGGGPAASALKQALPDLTTLAQRHDGKFPDHYVEDLLRNGVKVPAHGDLEMPVWGPVFKSMNSDTLFMYIRISSVMSYIKSLQVK